MHEYFCQYGRNVRKIHRREYSHKQQIYGYAKVHWWSRMWEFLTIKFLGDNRSTRQKCLFQINTKWKCRWNNIYSNRNVISASNNYWFIVYIDVCCVKTMNLMKNSWDSTSDVTLSQLPKQQIPFVSCSFNMMRSDAVCIKKWVDLPFK